MQSMDGVQSAQHLYKHVPSFEIGDQILVKDECFGMGGKNNLKHHTSGRDEL